MQSYQLNRLGSSQLLGIVGNGMGIVGVGAVGVGGVVGIDKGEHLRVTPHPAAGHRHYRTAWVILPIVSQLI